MEKNQNLPEMPDTQEPVAEPITENVAQQPINQEEQPAKVQSTTDEVVPAQTVEEPVPGNYTVESPVQEVQPAQEEQPMQKPKLKGRIFAIIACALLLLACVGGGLYAAIPQVRVMVQGETEFYKNFERKNLERFAENGGATWTTLQNNSKTTVAAAGLIDIDVTLSKKVVDNLGAPFDISHFRLKVDMTSKDDKQLYDATIEVGKEISVAAKVYIDSKNNKLILSAKDLLSKMIVVDMPSGGLLTNYMYPQFSLEGQDGTGATTKNNKLDFSKIAVSGEQLKGSLLKYIPVILDNIHQVNYKDGVAVEAGKLDQKAMQFTVTLDDKSTNKIAISLLEKLKQDNTLFKMIKSAAPPDSNFDKKEFETGINDAIKSIKDSKDMPKTPVVMDLYLDNQGKEIGRTLTITGSDKEVLKLGYLNLTKDGKYATQVTLQLPEALSDTNKIILLNQGKTSKEAVSTGDISLSVSDMTYTIHYQDVKVTVVDKIPMLSGKFSMTLAIPGDNTYLINADFSVKDKTQNISLSLKEKDDTLLFKANVALTNKVAKTIDIPKTDDKNSVSATDEQGLMTMVTESPKLMELLKKLGAPVGPTDFTPPPAPTGDTLTAQEIAMAAYSVLGKDEKAKIAGPVDKNNPVTKELGSVPVPKESSAKYFEIVMDDIGTITVKAGKQVLFPPAFDTLPSDGGEIPTSEVPANEVPAESGV